MNFYKHHIGDYAQATSHLTFVEDAAYSRLIRKYYADERPLPADLKAVQRLVGAREKIEREAVETVLNEFFTLEEDGWHQARCDAEIAAASEGQVERDSKKQNERERQRRHRERRKQLFDALRQHGEIPSYDTSTEDLVTLLSRVIERDASRSVTEPVTRDATANQTPDTRHQTPDIKPSAPAQVVVDPAQEHVEPPSAAVDVSMSLIAWERARGKVPRGIFAGDAKVQELAAMSPTPAELRKAYDLAVADRDATGDATPVNAGFVFAMLSKVRNPPKPRPRSLGQMTDNELEAEARRIGAHTHGYSRDQVIASIQAKRKQLEGVAA